jgi:hypothetical protein
MDEDHPPRPGDWMMGDSEHERVEMIADGPDAIPLEDYWEDFKQELEHLMRLMRN